MITNISYMNHLYINVRNFVCMCVCIYVCTYLYFFVCRYDDDAAYVLRNVISCSKHTSVLESLIQSLDCYPNRKACEIVRTLFKYEGDLTRNSPLSLLQLIEAAMESVHVI